MADVSTAQHRAALHQRALPGRYSGSHSGEGVRTTWQMFLMQLPLEAVLRVVDSGNVYSLFLFTRRRGANTAHTQMGRPTHEAPTREYTHKHTQTQTNAQRGPTKYGAGSRRGAALLIRGGRLAPTPSELHLCRDLPRRSYVHRHREAL